MSISRRGFMSLLGSSVAGAAVITVGSRVVGSPVAKTNAMDDWHIASIEKIDRGAAPFVLENRSTGAQLRIDVCRRGSAHAPLAESRDFGLYLANGGSGATRTGREPTVVARALARRLDSDRIEVPEALLSMEARLSQHPGLQDTSDDVANV